MFGLFLWLNFIILLEFVIVFLIFLVVIWGLFNKEMKFFWLLLFLFIFLVGFCKFIICLLILGICIFGFINILLYLLLKWFIKLCVSFICCFWLLLIGIMLVL